MSEELPEIVDPNSEEPVTLPVPVKTPKSSIATRSYSGQTGKKINDSPLRYEVIRMIADGMTYPEIVDNLHTHFNFRVAELTVAAFKKNFYHHHQERIDRWDKQRYQYVVARITEEMKEAARQMVHEVYELQHLLVVVDERIDLIRGSEDDAPRSAAYEGVLKDFVKTKASLLERMSKITGSTGVEARLKDMVKQAALAAQKTLVPYLKEDRRDDAFMLFDQEFEDILRSIDSGEAIAPRVVK